MKKFLALLLAVMMIASMSVTAFAAESDTNPNDDLAATLGGEEDTSLNNKEVTVVSKKADGEGDPAIVYHVVVTWQALDFQFDFEQEQTEMVWDPVNHKYTQEGGADLTGVWVTYEKSTAVDTNNDSKADKATIVDAVKLANHSNADVWVTAAVSAGAVNGVTTTIENADASKLDTGVGLLPADAKTFTADVSVSGVPTLVTKFTANTVTLTISATEPTT